jgi:hypothetical protein
VKRRSLLLVGLFLGVVYLGAWLIEKGAYHPPGFLAAIFLAR